MCDRYFIYSKLCKLDTFNCHNVSNLSYLYCQTKFGCTDDINSCFESYCWHKELLGCYSFGVSLNLDFCDSDFFLYLD